MDEPCLNEECDRCYPQTRFVVRTDSIRRTRHERVIKAATAEEALAIYNEGTEWPSSYDEQTIEIVEDPPQVLTHVDAYPHHEEQRRHWLEDCCYRLLQADE